MKKNKLLLGLLITGAALLSLQAHASNIEAFDMQRCVNMGNSLDSPRDQPWGKPIDPAHFKIIKERGFDTVRIPVRWSDYTAGQPDFTIERNFLKSVTDIVDAALSLDLNVILNVHHFEEIMDNPGVHSKKLIAIWAQLAPLLKDKPDSLWFEVINEPNNELKGRSLLTLQAKAVREIRKTNPERIIILGGEDWSGIRTLETNMMPPDANIVYTFHYYDPFAFTHQKAPWVGEDGPKEKRDWGSNQDYGELRQAVRVATTFREALDRPLFLGEFGAYEGVKNSERVEYVQDVRAAMEDAQIPWCLWSFSNTFALYDTDKEKWDDAMLKALIPEKPALKTSVISEKQVPPDIQGWGRFLTYFSGDTEHVSDVLTGVAVIKPGAQIHPPHKHIEEEFLMVLEGNGTWTIGNKDFAASSGDILYAAPWDLHGLKNTGVTPLRFVVFKYNQD